MAQCLMCTHAHHSYTPVCGKSLQSWGHTSQQRCLAQIAPSVWCTTPCSTSLKRRVKRRREEGAGGAGGAGGGRRENERLKKEKKKRALITNWCAALLSVCLSLCFFYLTSADLPTPPDPRTTILYSLIVAAHTHAHTKHKTQNTNE